MPQKRYPHGIDLVKNSIINVKVHPLSTLERSNLGLTLSVNDKGLSVIDIDEFVLYFWNGTGWSTTAVIAPNADTTDYDYDIVGVKNGMNTIFTLQNDYVVGSTHVFLNGQRLTPGLSWDFMEIGNKQIEFNYPLYSVDQILVDYKIQT